MKERDIVFEAGNFWVRRVKSGHYEIYKAGVAASVRYGTVRFSDDDDLKAREIAFQQCKTRNDKEHQQ